jgi:hypothetical protein
MSEVNFAKFATPGDKIEGPYEGTFKFRLGYALKIGGQFCSMTVVIADAVSRIKNLRKGDSLVITFIEKQKRTLVFDVYHNGTLVDRQGEVDLADAIKATEAKAKA